VTNPSDTAPRPHRGLWFEELEPGALVHHAIRRTLTESDNVMFTSMTMNPAWLHLDFDYARNQTEFGRPLVNSMLTLAVVIGISVHETTLGTTVANLGFSEIAFPAPVFHGDTLRVESEVLAARASRSRPSQGIVTFEHRGFKQDGTLVCRAVRDALMHRRPSGESRRSPR
jgi:acyl dehydratase